MKKSYIVRLIVFLCLTVLIWNNIGNVLITKNRNRNNASNPEAEGADIVFLGTSKGSLDINPIVLWDTQGIMAYNFSGSSQYIGNTYYILQEILSDFKPKVIALDIYGAIKPETFYMEGNILYNYTVVSQPWLRYQLYYDLMYEQFDQSILYYFSLLRYHGRWKELTSVDYETKQYVLGSELFCPPKGWQPIEKVPELPEPKEEVTIRSQEMIYLEKIVSLAEENGCKVIFLRMPGIFTEYTEKYVQDVAAFGTARGIALCDMMSSEFLSETKLTPRDFGDGDHLNIAGADKLSMWLGNYLIENDYVCDRRGDVAAVEWERKVEAARREDWNIRLGMNENFNDYISCLREGSGYEAAIILSGTMSEDANRELENVLDFPVGSSDNKVFWLKDGIMCTDESLGNTCEGGKSYSILPSIDMFISSDNGEISINNVSAKKINDGINIIVVDMWNEKVISTLGFDATEILSQNET